MATIYQNTLAWFNQLTQTNLVIIGIVATVVVVWFCLNQRQLRRLNHKVERLERDLRVTNSSAIAMGQNIIALEKQVRLAVTTAQENTVVAGEALSSVPVQDATPVSQQQFDAPAKRDKKPEAAFNFSAILNKENANTEIASDNNNVTDSSYDKARHYLTKGYSVNEVSRLCGLSYAEVSLLQALGKHSIASE